MWLILWVMLFELLAVYCIKKWGDHLDKAKQIFVVDGRIGWRQKANFNGKFLGIPLKTNELGLRNRPLTELKSKSKNIIILGPSSAFGWGVKVGQTYPFLLQELLERKYPGSSINVINSGQIGFSSWQGLDFYKNEILKNLQVDLVIIAYGINDVDRFRFFYTSTRSDKEEFAIPKTKAEVFLQNIAIKINFFNLLSRKVFKLFDNFKYFQRAVPTRRVTDGDFIENIEKLIQLGKTRGSEVILLTSAYQLPSFQDVDTGINNLSNKYFNDGKSRYQEEKYSEALTNFLKAIEIKPDQNEIYYYLSCCYFYLGNRSKSKEMFERALNSEPRRIARDMKEINNILRNIAQKNSIILVDIEEYFRLMRDGDMFIDPVHFSARGHERIASNLAQLVYGRNLLKINKEGH